MTVLIIVIVEPWRVAKKVVQPDGHAVSVSRRVVIAVTVISFDEAVVAAELMLAAAGVVRVVHDEELEVVLELLLENVVLLDTSEGAGS